MIDSLVIASLATASISVIIALLTHLKHSSCCGLSVDTYSPSELQPQPQIIISQPATPHNTPTIELKHSNQTSV